MATPGGTWNHGDTTLHGAQSGQGRLLAMNGRGAEERLPRLKACAQGLKRWAWVGLILAALLVFVAARQGQTRVIRAERFELADSKGNVRAYLGFTDDRDPVPMFAFSDKKGMPRFLAVLADDGSMTVSLSDTRGDGRIMFVVEKDGSPSLGLNGTAGKGGLGLMVYENGESRLGLRDARERERAILRLQPGRGPELALADADGMERTALRLSEEGTPTLRMLTPEGRVFWAAPPRQDRSQ